MDRLQVFETMFEDIVKKADKEKQIMEDLRKQGKKDCSLSPVSRKPSDV